MQQGHKPKRTLPVPPVSKYQDRSPSRYHDRDHRRSEYEEEAARSNYISGEARRKEYQSSRSDPNTMLPNSHSPYDTHGQRNVSPRSYRDSHSPRSTRNESPHALANHKSNSSHSLKRDVSPRPSSRDRRSSHLTGSHPEDDRRAISDMHRDPQSRNPHINDLAASAAWQRSSLPARTRPRSPSSPLNSWQRSSLPAHARNRLSPSAGHQSLSARTSQSQGLNRYVPTSDNQANINRPPLLTSRSESYSYSFKKRHSDTRNINLSSYDYPKDYGRQGGKYDKNIQDANAPYEAHFKHRRNSSLDTGTHFEGKMKRSSTNYRDFLHSASLDDHARAALRKEADEDEAYRILKEGLQIAKSRVVYKFDRTLSQEQKAEEMALAQEPPPRPHSSRQVDDYVHDEYDRYHAAHHDVYQSRAELDRMSHYSSRSNPLENHSNSYIHNSRPYTTHDSYNHSPLSYNHVTSTYNPGSNVTQTSTQTEETSLSAPYTSYTAIPNHYGWTDVTQPKLKRNFFNFNFNFFRNRNTNKKKTDNKFIYMKSPAPQHCTQVLATLAVALGPLCAGLGKGYSSPALASMAALSAQGHHFSISKDQGSWVASLSLLGAFFGSLPAGMSIRYGRKRVLCLVAVPFALSWVLTVVATNVYMLYAASLLGGVCTAIIAVVTPVYISEIAHPDIRGCLCNLSRLSSNIGMLLSYLLGAFLNWRQLATVTATAPACLFLAALLIPETPSYLLYRGRDTEAAASLAWLRSGRDVARELTTMKANIATLRRQEVQEPPSVAFRDLLRPLFVTCGLMVFQKFSGANAFNFYAVPILSETFVGLDPYRAAVVVAFVQICAGMASSALVDTVGRRPLLVFSNMLMSAALAAFGGYVYLKGLDTNEDMFARQQWRQSDWVPLFCILVIEIAFALGVSPISWLYIGELFPLKHRGFGALAASVSYACSFASVKSFVDLQLTLGLYGAFWLYSSLSALALVFTLLFVPETKGLSLQEMQEQHKSVLI